MRASKESREWQYAAFAGAMLLTAAGMLAARFAGGLGSRTALGCGLGVVAAAVLVGYIAVLDRESRKRQGLYERLAAAQADLAAAERESGILAERQRLAREVHDTLTQGFASIAMLLDAARADLPAGGPAAGRVEQAMRTARDNLAESRRLVRALRPLPLAGAQLGAAVRELTDRLRQETGIRAEAVVTGTPRATAPAVEAELLRVVQEALTNVRRHSGATEATVTLSYMDDALAVDVADDGRGFEPAAAAPGVGLAAMRERAAQLGGTLAVESAPGEGTTVALAVPAGAR